MSLAERSPMSRRVKMMWVFRVAGPAGALALAALMLLVFRRPAAAHDVDAGRMAGGLVMVVVIMAWSFTFAWLTARQEDEYTLAAAKFAWFWGGLIGLACSAPVLAFLVWSGVMLPALRPGGGGPALYLVVGYALPLVFQLVGFVAARAWWGRRGNDVG